MIKRQRGLTLVELMVTVAVAIVLLAVGVPLFTGVVANNRAAAQTNTYLAAFKLARSEAVKRGVEVSVCSIDDLDDDPLVCGAANDWHNGAIVFTDTGTLGVVDGTDTRVRVFPLSGSGLTVTAGASFVRFRGQGEIDEAATAASTACPSSETCLQLDMAEATSQFRCVHLLASGQVRAEREVCD